MRKRVARIGVRVASFFLAMMFMVTPAFAVVREVNVYGVKSINDLGSSDQRIDMDTLKDAYSDYVQTDTLREYFHKDKSEPTKVDLDQALSWLIDNNIISRDQTITVSNCGSNQIPKVNIVKFDTNELKGMNVYRTDVLMYMYKAAFGPINARVIGVETDNIRVDDGEYITLKDLMEKNGYTTNPNYVLPGSGSITVNGQPGTAGSGNGGGGSASSGSSQQTNYINDMSNWRYQPQGDLWESIFGDTNIFISQNNFQQGINGGAAGNGGGGGAGIGGGGSGGGGNGGTSGNQTQVNTGNVGSIQGSDNTQTTTNSNNITGEGKPVSGDGSSSGSTGSGSASYSSGSGGSGGQGGDANTGDNTINYETDYKQIYFIPGADLLVYNTSDVPEVYIQAALSKGLLGFESEFREDLFESEFVTWRKNNPNTLQSWDGGSPAYIVNRSRNVLKTVSDTEQVPLQEVLGKCWNVSWQSNTLTISRVNPFKNLSGYFTTELVTKMDAYEYAYRFIQGSEKVLSQLESDIVNYKYGMELDGITDSEGTEIIKYLIAKGIINYEVTNEFMALDSAISWDDFISLLYRVANKDARYDFSKIQLTDSETQWKAKGYSPQTTYMVPGDNFIRTQVTTVADYATQDFGTDANTLVGTTGTGIPAIDEVVSSTDASGRTVVGFGTPDDKTYVFTDGGINDVYFYGLASTFEGAMSNTGSSNGLTYPNVSAAATMFGVSAPSTNLGKYTLTLLYALADCSKSQLEAKWTNGYEATNPKFQLMRNVTCNIWALCDMANNSSAKSEVNSILAAGLKPKDATTARPGWQMSDELKDKLESKGTADAFVAAVSEIKTHLSDNAYNNGVQFQKFQFTDDSGHVVDYSNDWVAITGGNISTLVNTFTGVEMRIKIDNEMKTFIIKAPKNVGYTRGGGTETEPWNVNLTVSIAADLINPNLTPEEQERERLLNYNNNLTSFANLTAINDTPLTTYVEPNTNECYVSWSTIEKYRQTSSTGEKSLPIKKISDFVLYNTDTCTYAYFNNEKDDKRALVGTDIVTCNNDYGVAYRDGSELYYLIDAVRLLLDSRQEASLLGGIRSMPLASTTVQSNLTKVTIDNNDGTPTQSLTGICVMLSDNDEETKKHITNSNSVYYTDTTVYNNARWGNFLAISQANRAINATSRQFSYTGKDGTKLTAYAVVIYEPLSARDMGYTNVDATSSLQDLLDAPMKQPESEEDQEQWQKNKLRSNLLANWIYGTTGREYISTGYIIPHAYVFSSDPDIAGCMTDAEWGCLIAGPNPELGIGSERELVSFVRLYQVINGAVDRFGSAHNYKPEVVRNDANHKASYMLSADYQLCVLGNRVYLNLGCFKNMSKTGATKLRASNIVLGSAAFTVGSTFKSIVNKTRNTVDGKAAPTIKVIKTETNGLVTCQVGPIYGVPLIPGPSQQGVVIHDYATKKTSIDTIGDYDWTTAANNQVQYVFEYMFQPTGFEESYADIELLGISTQPILEANSTRTYMFDGTTLYTFKGEARISKDGRAGAYIAAMDPGNKISTLLSSMNSSNAYQTIGNSMTEGNVETYFNIRFNAFNYTVENGILKYRPNQASDYISPSLFTSLNDLIINGVMNADNGAIPIEQVPFGSLIQIGTGWYVAYGNSEEDIAFVGYAPLQGFTEYNDTVTIQDAAKSFATQFIRAGNQQLNISHFFADINVLSELETYKEPLKILNESKMAEDSSSSKICILAASGDGDDHATPDIYNSSNSTAPTFYYAGVNVSFQKGILKAYRTSEDGVEPARYTIVSNAETSVTGPLDQLPFFSENALSGSMSDRTTSANSGGFIQFYGAENLMDNIHMDFQKAFAGDLFTLARMLVFIILIWLVVASWLCYGTYFGGLMPILDAIKHPTGNQAGSGIDLMKIVSLGSISMETDFKLGRFIQYNLVLAALLCVVYLTGIYL